MIKNLSLDDPQVKKAMGHFSAPTGVQRLMTTGHLDGHTSLQQNLFSKAK